MTKTADVVLGNQITVPWGNEIRDRSIQVVASTAERDSAFPGPVKGQTIYIASGDAAEGIYTWDGTAWRLPWNQPWGLWSNNISGGFNIGTTPTVEVDLFSFNWTPVPNRKYRVEYQAQIENTTGTAFGKDGYIAVTDAANVWWYYAGGVAGPSVNFPYQLNGVGYNINSLGSAVRNWKLRGGCGLANTAITFYASSVMEGFVMITDIGPMTGAPA